MADRPIIFSAPMVRALLFGRKTQTRRLLRPQPDPTLARPTHFVAVGWERRGAQFAFWEAHDQRGPVSSFRGPPGCVGCHCKTVAKGDRLWVRETWLSTGTGIWTIADARCRFAHDQETRYAADGDEGPWWPSIHMPREFSRLTLTVTDVRVQPLQGISREDVIAEGITDLEDVVAGWHEPYARLWNSMHGAGAWDMNPWVAAISFTVHHANIDALPVAVGLPPQVGAVA